jgi:hypothetical protein
MNSAGYLVARRILPQWGLPDWTRLIRGFPDWNDDPKLPFFFKEGLKPHTSSTYYIYTLWLFNIAMENGPFMDGLAIKNGDFPWLC